MRFYRSTAFKKPLAFGECNGVRTNNNPITTSSENVQQESKRQYEPKCDTIDQNVNKHGNNPEEQRNNCTEQSKVSNTPIHRGNEISVYYADTGQDLDNDLVYEDGDRVEETITDIRSKN